MHLRIFHFGHVTVEEVRINLLIDLMRNLYNFFVSNCLEKSLTANFSVLEVLNKKIYHIREGEKNKEIEKGLNQAKQELSEKDKKYKDIEQDWVKYNKEQIQVINDLGTTINIEEGIEIDKIKYEEHSEPTDSYLRDLSDQLTQTIGERVQYSREMESHSKDHFTNSQDYKKMIDSLIKSAETLFNELFLDQSSLRKKLEKSLRNNIKLELNSMGVQVNQVDLANSYLRGLLMRKKANKTLKDLISSYLDFKEENKQIKRAYLNKIEEFESEKEKIVQGNYKLIKEEHKHLAFTVVNKVATWSINYAGIDINPIEKNFMSIFQDMINKIDSKFVEFLKNTIEIQMKLEGILDEYEELLKKSD